MSNLALDNLVGTITNRVTPIRFLVDKMNEQISSNLLFMKEKGLECPFPRDILILGCGGTGSWFMPKFIKILNDAIGKEMIRSEVNVVLCDGDIVEEKNLIRQNFIDQDINKNKAAIMAERYGAHAHEKVNVGFLDTYLVGNKYDIPEDFAEKFTRLSSLEIFKGGAESTLIINLIDNGKTRKMVHDFSLDWSANYGRKSIVIDVANNEYNGQLTTSIYGIINPSAYVSRFYNELPNQLGENDDISAFSCADEDATQTDQLFNANDMAASVLGNYLNAWAVENKIQYGRVDFVTGGMPSITPSRAFHPWATRMTNIMRMGSAKGFYNHCIDASRIDYKIFEKLYEGLNDDERVVIQNGFSEYVKEVSDNYNGLGYRKDLQHAML